MRLFGFSILLCGTMAAGLFAVQTMGHTPNPAFESAAGLAVKSANLTGELSKKQKRTPVVAELFTSQGCSSCPPADELAGRMVVDPSIIVLTRPVTYWDRLGWKDTLARPENTSLQYQYAKRGGEGAGVYTPQMIVDGRGAAVGSREKPVRKLIKQARFTNKPTIQISTQTNGGHTVRIAGATDKIAIVTLVALASSETVYIGRGENRGREIHYSNVVKREVSLGKWSGGEMEMDIDSKKLRVAGADKYVILVQQQNAGPILGASWI